MKKTGIVLQGIGGFYYVEADDTVYCCRARGAFRQQGLTPVAGDRVTVSVPDSGDGVVEEILPRKNCLIRPPVANLDVLVIVASVRDPAPNLLVLDKMIAIAEKQSIDPVLVVNKTDLADPCEMREIYEKAGIECLTVCAHVPETLEPLRKRLAGKISAFTGNSGVGKSSLLNALDPASRRQTGEISRKLGRGRHTTRWALLTRFAGGYLADTPGFSSLELDRVAPISKEELPDCFREFQPYMGRCRFTGCAHYKEPGCAVREAVETGEIPRSRYDSYVTLYESVKDKKEWET